MGKLTIQANFDNGKVMDGMIINEQQLTSDRTLVHRPDLSAEFCAD